MNILDFISKDDAEYIQNNYDESGLADLIQEILEPSELYLKLKDTPLRGKAFLALVGIAAYYDLIQPFEEFPKDGSYFHHNTVNNIDIMDAMEGLATTLSGDLM